MATEAQREPRQPMATPKDLAFILRFKSITAEGLRYPWKITRQETEISFDQFAICCDWLQGVGHQKSISKRHSSYAAKHMVENWRGEYVSNGAFIAAAIHMGFNYASTWNGSPNTFFNISWRTVPGDKMHGKKKVRYPA